MVEVAKLSEFVRIFEDPRIGKPGVFFRGHACMGWKAVPAIFRQSNLLSCERAMIKEVISQHPEEFYRDRTTFEYLVRAQHHGIPTRLLDITINPLVALYFACCSHENEDGEVIAFKISEDRVKLYDSDTVSCVANLANLTSEEKERLKSHLDTGPSSSFKIGDFNRRSEIERLVHFIRDEKPHFAAKVRPIAFRRILAVLPKKSNRRILAQSGAFLIFGFTKSIEKGLTGISLVKIKIPADKKNDLIRQLNIFNVNRGSLFPEIESSAEVIRQKYINVSRITSTPG